jgi:aryl-alcohol dehydrogenase-like predicted oxidoreductase
MGCWAIVGDSTWGAQEEGDAIAAIRASLDAGVNFFDTAEAYGDGYSEELLAKALKGRRDEAVLASKVSPNHLDAATLRERCETSLRLLDTDRIDLYQVHWPSRQVPLADALETLEALRAEGKIRALGVSNYGKQDLTELLGAGRVESDQLCYSLLFRAVEHDVQQVCVDNDLSLLCYSPLCQGLLTGKFASAGEVPEGRARTRLFSKDRPQSRHREPGCEAELFAALAEVRRICEAVGRPMSEVALAWLLAQPGVTSVIAGARNAEQARANARAGDLELPPTVVAQLSAATEVVKQKLGPNADMWQTESRMR